MTLEVTSFFNISTEKLPTIATITVAAKRCKSYKLNSNIPVVGGGGGGFPAGRSLIPEYNALKASFANFEFVKLSNRYVK